MVKPPYGVLAAIDLSKGDLKWQVPHGDTPDVVRNHPKLKGLTIPKTGQGGSVGVLVTKTLVIAADPQVTTTPEHPRGAMMRAYDKQTGKEVGAVWMPAPVSGSPMTYRVGGRQFIVIAVSGGNYSGEYLAFSLPESDTPDTSGTRVGRARTVSTPRWRRRAFLMAGALALAWCAAALAQSVARIRLGRRLHRRAGDARRDGLPAGMRQLPRHRAGGRGHDTAAPGRRVHVELERPDGR